MSRRRVADNLDVVGVRKESTAERPAHLGTRTKRGLQEFARVECMAAPSAHRRQVGKARDLDAPPLVIREMHVEDVELVAGHQVERAQHRGLGMEVARDVEHEAAVAEARRVHDAECRQYEPAARRWWRQQSAQGLETVEDACG